MQLKSATADLRLYTKTHTQKRIRMQTRSDALVMEPRVGGPLVLSPLGNVRKERCYHVHSTTLLLLAGAC
eukprot:5837337-Amphidinium_carterae.1